MTTHLPPPKHHTAPQRLAWNGISITTAPEWSPTTLSRTYLRADDEAGPALEIRWGQVRGRFDPDKHLRRLHKGLGGDVQLGTRGDIIPGGWREAVEALTDKGYRATAFAWRKEDTTQRPNAGRGAIVSCPEDGMACFVQFFDRPECGTAHSPAELLRTLTHHPASGPVPWEVFGIRATLPGWLRLKDFSFHPGQFTLRFAPEKAPHTADVTLERIGPADVLLRRSGLRGWCEEFLNERGLPGESLCYAPPGEHAAAVEGSAAPPGGLRGLACRLSSRPRHIQARTWLPTPGNMILCAVYRSRKDIPSTLFDEICSSYELAPSQTPPGP